MLSEKTHTPLLFFFWSELWKIWEECGGIRVQHRVIMITEGRGPEEQNAQWVRSWTSHHSTCFTCSGPGSVPQAFPLEFPNSNSSRCFPSKIDHVKYQHHWGYICSPESSSFLPFLFLWLMAHLPSRKLTHLDLARQAVTIFQGWKFQFLAACHNVSQRAPTSAQ